MNGWYRIGKSKYSIANVHQIDKRKSQVVLYGIKSLTTSGIFREGCDFS